MVGDLGDIQQRAVDLHGTSDPEIVTDRGKLCRMAAGQKEPRPLLGVRSARLTGNGRGGADDQDPRADRVSPL